MLPTIARIAAGTMLLFALVACPTTPTGSVTSVTIVGGDRTLAQGFSTTLDADVTTTGSANDTVTWTSTDTDIATIDTLGTLDALTPGTTTITATSTHDPAQSDTITVAIDPPGALRWTRQFGTGGSDVAEAIATDASGNVYSTGRTSGDLESTNAGSGDAFVRSYDDAGVLRWTRQFGTSANESAYAAATDANGNVYVSGYTSGDLAATNAGFADAFVRSYDGAGALRWTRQFGTGGDDIAWAVATDTNGNVYIAGVTDGALEGANAGALDAFVRSYDDAGTLRWTRQFGTSTNDVAVAVATDANGNVYIAGYSSGTLDGANAGALDAFVRSYDDAGALRWTRQFGTIWNDLARGVAIDTNGNVYIVGTTAGGLNGANAGGDDAFVRSYDSVGALRWTRQFGTSSDDVARGVAIDSHANVYIAGDTAGALDGGNAGGSDGFVRSYDSVGALRWTRQFGTSSDDVATGVAVDPSADVYATGRTAGALAGESAGGVDAFIHATGP